jgi:hypothetical protein
MSKSNDTCDTRQQASELTHAAAMPSPFTAWEWSMLFLLRRRYQQGRDLLDSHELARLSFVRWLVRTGRLDP